MTLLLAANNFEAVCVYSKQYELVYAQKLKTNPDIFQFQLCVIRCKTFFPLQVVHSF